MKTVLLIDRDDELFNYFKDKFDDLKFVRANNAPNAKKMLENENIDYAIIELSLAKKATLDIVEVIDGKIPVMILSDDGKELAKEYPQIPKNLKFQRPIELECILATFKALIENKVDTLQHIHNLSEGEILFMEGEMPDSLYWLVAGKLNVYTNVDGMEKEVGQVNKNEIVGEMAFLGVKSRSATLRAQTSCQLLEIPASKFTDLVNAQPQWFQSILNTMAIRLRDSNKNLY